jgi:RNA polymerase sigma-70 factor (ECF subfamily)
MPPSIVLNSPPIPLAAMREQRLRDGLRRLAAGDESGLEPIAAVLLVAGRPSLRTLGLDHDEADDAVQATLIDLVRVAGRYDPARGKATTFCFVILRRRAIDLLRRRPPAVPLEEFVELAAPAPDPLLRIEIEEAIDRIPSSARESAMLWLSGVSRAEIAWRTDSDAATVAARLRRAQRSLKRSLVP